MKLFNNVCEFPYSWEQVTQGVWRKYPNDMSTHVQSVDVLDRKVQDNGTKLVTHRLITCKQNIPEWVSMFMGVKGGVSYILEISEVDLIKQKFIMKSCNLTGSKFIKVMECVQYEPLKNEKNKTLFKQEAQITAYASFLGISNKIENWSVKRFNDNAAKGKKGFESVLNTLFDTKNPSIHSGATINNTGMTSNSNQIHSISAAALGN